MDQTNNIISHALVALLFLAIGFGIGYSMSSSSVGMDSMPGIDGAGSSEVSGSNTEENGSEGASDTEAGTVSAGDLTEGQIALAKAFGVDPNNITITDTMIACAEAKLGAGRVTEITNGATPSFTEGVTLAACYTGG